MCLRHIVDQFQNPRKLRKLDEISRVKYNTICQIPSILRKSISIYIIRKNKSMNKASTYQLLTATESEPNQNSRL